MANTTLRCIHGGVERSVDGSINFLLLRLLEARTNLTAKRDVVEELKFSYSIIYKSWTLHEVRDANGIVVLFPISMRTVGAQNRFLLLL